MSLGCCGPQLPAPYSRATEMVTSTDLPLPRRLTWLPPWPLGVCCQENLNQRRRPQKSLPARGCAPDGDCDVLVFPEKAQAVLMPGHRLQIPAGFFGQKTARGGAAAHAAPSSWPEMRGAVGVLSPGNWGSIQPRGPSPPPTFTPHACLCG